MKFKLLEKVVTIYKGSTSYEADRHTYIIYKNPSPQDLSAKDESRENRAIIDSDGNLYVESMYLADSDEEYSYILHGDLIRILHKNGECMKLKDMDLSGTHSAADLKNGVFMYRRNGNSRTFFIASYDISVLDDPEARQYIRKNFKKCSKKNPLFTFVQKQE
jgi:hypothetical protein